MATGGDPSVPLGGPMTSDPKSMAENFWKQLCDGNERLAQEIGRLIQPPALSAFAFDDLEAESGERGTLTVAVAADTPSIVMDAWNLVKDVHVIVCESDWCYAPVNKGWSQDFRACTLTKVGAGALGECTKTTHMDVAGKEQVKRMDVKDLIGVYAIVCPVSSAVVAQTTSCFSNPIFILASSQPICEVHEDMSRSSPSGFDH